MAELAALSPSALGHYDGAPLAYHATGVPRVVAHDRDPMMSRTPWLVRRAPTDAPSVARDAAVARDERVQLREVADGAAFHRAFQEEPCGCTAVLKRLTVI